MRRGWVVILLLVRGLWAAGGDDLITHVRAALAYKNIALAENEIASYPAQGPGVRPPCSKP